MFFYVTIALNSFDGLRCTLRDFCDPNRHGCPRHAFSYERLPHPVLFPGTQSCVDLVTRSSSRSPGSASPCTHWHSRCWSWCPSDGLSPHQLFHQLAPPAMRSFQKVWTCFPHCALLLFSLPHAVLLESDEPQTSRFAEMLAWLKPFGKFEGVLKPQWLVWIPLHCLRRVALVGIFAMDFSAMVLVRRALCSYCPPCCSDSVNRTTACV